MGRKSIEIESFKHVNPIPAASRIGPLLVSSVIAPRDPGEQTVPETPEAQYANLFVHIGQMLDVAGTSPASRSSYLMPPSATHATRSGSSTSPTPTHGRLGTVR